MPCNRSFSKPWLALVFKIAFELRITNGLDAEVLQDHTKELQLVGLNALETLVANVRNLIMLMKVLRQKKILRPMICTCFMRQ